MVEKVRIREELLEYLLELARSFYPNEFAGFLREKDGIFEEVLIAPAGHFGRTSAFFNTWMLPLDDDVKGTVHSHPDHVCWPSRQDLWFFSKFGGVHLIICYPFTPSDVRAFLSSGEPVEIEVVP
ncbi:Mov34/MPN/PAD-1 family protein [Thermococcus sp. AM4]|uniref:Mov34/MPN/PAD-1 family protein n=1 Tax=Thermococcus sp. (strain AM4) TaxID=246969 RepID=UPI0001870523|nr:Mov34/MPN/PAD-1 family protein [Thermococcus sp. AM4]EEB74495.1 metal-dependent protease, Mov34/MPN/PAD-1 superfamily [Thermococcus sp. AM4]